MTTFIGKYLNPGEVECLLKTERDERRKTRLNQVRQQAREKASKIVLAVKKERGRQLRNLSNHLEAEWLKDKQEQVEELGQQYGKNLTLVGEAHSNIRNEIIAKEALILKIEDDKLKAAARGATALNEVRSQQLKDAENVLKQDALRKAVKNAENERAREIAALPLPPTPPHSTLAIQKDKREVSTAHNHVQMPAATSAINKGTLLPPNDLDLVKVIKITANDEVDAHLAAQLEKVKQAELMQKKNQEKIVQTKKERERYLKAKSQLELQKDYNRIMNKLEELVKQEDVCSEPHLLLGLEKENSVLKQEQEAIVEELFSRLGLPLLDSAIARDSSTASCMENEAEIHVRSSNAESTTDESAGDATPVVHVLAHDSSVAISRVLESPLATRTEDGTSSESRTTTLSDIYAKSYPMEGTTSVGDSSTKASEWSGMTPINATVGSFPTSGTTPTTNDETILAGHFHPGAFDSSENVPVLHSLDSTDSKVSPGTSQLVALEKRLNDMNSLDYPMTTLSDRSELQPHTGSFIESSASKSKYDNSDRSNAKQDKQKVSMQTSSPIDRNVVSEDLQKGKPNILDDRLRRLALTNLLASKKLGASQAVIKNLPCPSHNEFRDVEIVHASRDELGKFANASKSRTSSQFSMRNFGLPESHLPDSAAYISNPEIKELAGSIFNTPVTTISGLQPNSSSLRLHTRGLGLTPFPVLPNQFSFRPTLIKTPIGKTEPLRDLSTIIEVDTPGSSQHTCWQNSSTLNISKELESGERFSHGFDMNEPGITDEPDLTLVSSEWSTCSPNQSHVFDVPNITPSIDSFVNMSECMQLANQSDREMKRYRGSTLFTNTKRRDQSEKMADTGSSLTVRGADHQELAYFLRDLDSSESLPVDNYSSSVDSSGKKPWSTPTLSSSESHSCFSGELQKLHAIKTPDLEFLSGSNLPSFFTQSSNIGEMKSQEEFASSSFSQPCFMSTLDSTLENCTDSLLSFIVHEGNANLNHSSALDNISTPSLPSSNHVRFLSSQSESISDSMFSFLRHEVSADDSSFSGMVESSTRGHIS